jgi:hypothetical protein
MFKGLLRILIPAITVYNPTMIIYFLSPVLSLAEVRREPTPPPPHMADKK